MKDLEQRTVNQGPRAAAVPLTPQDAAQLAQLLIQAPPQTVFQLAPGRYQLPRLTSSVELTLRGEDPAQTVIELEEGLRVEQESLRLEGLTLHGGRGDLGGAITVVNDSHLELERCVLSGNNASEAGGALHVGPGTAQVKRCLFSANRAPVGAAATVGEQAEVIFDRCLFLDNTAEAGSALLIVVDAHVLITSCTFLRNRISAVDEQSASAVALLGTLSAKPQASLINSLLGDPRPLANAPQRPGLLRLASCLLPPNSLKGLRYSNGYDNLEAEARLTELAGLPLLAPESPGRALADITEIDTDALDFLGRPLVVQGDADPGALGLLRKEDAR